MKKDLYDALGVDKTASKAAVRKAYRKRARETHPDREGNSEEFNEVRKAYAVLGDDARRKKYDETGEADLGIDNANAEAVGILYQGFVSVMQEVISTGRDPSKRDLIAGIKAILNQRKTALESQRRDMEVARAKLLDVEKRFSVKKGAVNYLGRVAGDHVRQVDNQLKGQAAEEAKLAKAFELLDAHKYNFDPETVMTMAITGVHLNWGRMGS